MGAGQFANISIWGYNLKLIIVKFMTFKMLF